MRVFSSAQWSVNIQRKEIVLFHVYYNKNHMLCFPRHVQKLRDGPPGLVSLGFSFLATPFSAMLLFRFFSFFSFWIAFCIFQGCMHPQMGDVVLIILGVIKQFILHFRRGRCYSFIDTWATCIINHINLQYKSRQIQKTVHNSLHT